MWWDCQNETTIHKRIFSDNEEINAIYVRAIAYLKFGIKRNNLVLLFSVSVISIVNNFMRCDIIERERKKRKGQRLGMVCFSISNLHYRSCIRVCELTSLNIHHKFYRYNHTLFDDILCFSTTGRHAIIFSRSQILQDSRTLLNSTLLHVQSCDDRFIS